jgi:hypothetical protein
MVDGTRFSLLQGCLREASGQSKGFVILVPPSHGSPVDDVFRAWRPPNSSMLM